MSTYDSNPRKTVGNDSAASKNDKPARITVEDGDGATAYDVEHHVRSERGGWVSMYLTRDGSGIDVQVPRERVISIERGREHHTGDGESEKELVADGGVQLRDAPEVETGEIVHERRTIGRRGRDDRRTIPMWTRVEHVTEDGDVKLSFRTEDGEGAINTEWGGSYAREDLSRCATCGELKTYDDARCDECAGGENDGE